MSPEPVCESDFSCLAGPANATTSFYGGRKAVDTLDASTSNCHHGRHADYLDSGNVECNRCKETDGRVSENKLTTTIEHGVDMTVGTYLANGDLRLEEH